MNRIPQTERLKKAKEAAKKKMVKRKTKKKTRRRGMTAAQKQTIDARRAAFKGRFG